MTSKFKTPISSSQFNKLEAEVEKLRNENKWMRLYDFASGIGIKDQKTEILSKFCQAESELENHLFANPIMNNELPQELNVVKSSTNNNYDNLYNVEQILKDILVKSDKQSMCVEASILLAKLYLSQSKFDDALKQINSPKLNAILTDHFLKLKQHQQSNAESNFAPKYETPRQLQLFAEIHCIRGLCLEKKRMSNMSATHTQTKIGQKLAEEITRHEEQEIIDSFEVGSLLAISHSVLMHQFSTQTSLAANLASSSSAGQNLDTNSASLTLNLLNNNDDNLDLINPLYEIALQKAPLLYIKRGDLSMGMKKFRDLLLKKHIQSITSIRQILLKKYAECLIFNIPTTQYSPLKLTLNNDKYNEENNFKKSYKIIVKLKRPVFKPANQDEEILLCLNLSQYLASKEVMLLRQTQFKQIREQSFNNAVNSLDLLLYYLGYHRSYNVLLDKFEMTMKYSFEQFYVWYQHGLTLICDQKYYKAYCVLKECVRMKPDHVTSLLLLAKLALENLLFIDDAVDWCSKVLELTGGRNVKALLITGCAMIIKAKLQKQHASQISFYEKSIEAFKKANSIEPGDYLPLYHMAHCYAIMRQINESLDCIQKALKYKPDDKESLHLLALLLTSTKNYEEAHTVISKACALCDDIELMFTKIRTEEVLYGYNHSVNSIVNLAMLYKKKILSPKERNGSTASSASAISAAQQGAQPINKSSTQINQNLDNWSNFENASLLNLQQVYKLNEAIGKTVTMLIQNDQIAFKCEHPQSQYIHHTLVLTRILTQIGEFYLRHDKLNDAELCCQEIAFYHPMSYLYIYLKGRINEYKQDFSQAKACYQNALSINPFHIQSLQQLALCLCQLQNFHLAEKMIRDAIALNSSLPDSWNILGRILDYQNDNQSAMKCYSTCLQLEATNPIIPFSSITRVL